VARATLRISLVIVGGLFVIYLGYIVLTLIGVLSGDID
jgi:hypothetical protein